MIISTAISATPFVGVTDSVRVQMSGKYLSQSVTHLNCQRPYVIGNNWKYLTETSTLTRYTAPLNGKILFENNDIMILLFENKQIEILKVPRYLPISYNFTSQLRYKRKDKNFNTGDLIYEYDNFIDGIPSFGYNTNVAYMPFFGFNFEDAIIVSESFANRAKVLKSETITIPIYSYTLFKNIYENSKFKFIPEIGQEIDDKIICSLLVPKSNSNTKKQVLAALSLYNIADLSNDDFQFNTNHILSKIANSKIYDIRVHKLNNNIKLIDTQLQANIEKIVVDYRYENNKVYNEVSNILGTDYAKQVLTSNYIMTNSPYSTEELVYILEIKVVKELTTSIGDKLCNRFANKGVISLIIPDELRPVNVNTGEPIDIIQTPLGIFNRMNLGQIIEGVVSKCIHQCQKNISIENVENILEKLSTLAVKLGNESYSEEILELKNNKIIHNDLIKDIKQNGLYFEAPNFSKFDIVDITKFIENQFNIKSNDDILVKKELIEYMFNKLGMVDKSIIPNEDVVYKNIFNAPIYIMKLKQIASSKLNARDFGDYSSVSKTPLNNRQNNISRSARIGSMESDGFVAHSAIKTLKEIRSVKSSAIGIKSDLVNQVISSGQYNLPQDKSKSYVKVIIDSMITFINEN
jgi:DNA-directed RNA polymerase beta subunit